MQIFGDDIRFGVHSGPQNTTFEDYRDLWLRCEELGYEWVSDFDHFYPINSDPTGPQFEGLTLLSAMAAHTSRVRCAMLVLGVTYQTPVDALEKIPSVVKQIIEKEERTRFDRAHFKAFGASSLDVEVVYFVTSPEYLVFMDIQQRVNLEILRQLTALGVDFAYPTQTIYAQVAGAPTAGRAG